MNLRLYDIVVIERNDNKLYCEQITYCDYVQRKCKADIFWINGDNYYIEADNYYEYKLLKVFRLDENYILRVIHDFTDDEKCKAVDVPSKVEYDKYMTLRHENEELKNIIVELNKKLYRRDDGE